MNFYKHFIFVCLAAIGACAVSCSDDTFGTDNNNIDGRLHFRAKVIQNKQLTKGSRAAQPADACIEARNIQGPSFQGKTIWLQERTINGIFPPLKQRAATRGDIVPSVGYLSDTFISLYLWGYRAKKEKDSYESWLANEELTINKDNGTGTFVNENASDKKYCWSADKPYCKFFALCGNGLSVSEDDVTFDNDKKEHTAHFHFTCPEDVSDQLDLLAASKDVDYNQANGAPVNLDLCHALAAVRFSLDLGNFPKNINLQKVQLQNVVTEGTYTFPTTKDDCGNWEINNKAKPSTLSSSLLDIPLRNDKNTLIKLGTDLKKEGKNDWDSDHNTFFVIPQQSKDIKVCLFLNKAEGDEDKAQKIVISLGHQEFKAGTTKIFNISANNSLRTFITEGPGTIYVNSNKVNFQVLSYFVQNNQRTPAPWEYVGYEDGKGDMHERTTPKWITSVTKEGVGITKDKEWNEGYIEVDNKHKITFPWDDELVKAAQKGNENNPYNLANKKGEKKIEETANCYVISAPGVYTIPLVYGNAIKNGGENPKAYTFNGNLHDDDVNEGYENAVLRNFVNADNEAINSPYIKGAKYAEMLWQDRPKEGEKVSNLQIKYHKDEDKNKSYYYLQFKVSKENIKSGNALVAVTDGKKDAEGHLRWLWSWHLWFVPEKEYGGTAAYNGRNIAEYPLGYTPYTYGPEEKEADRKVKLVFRQVGHPNVESKFTVEHKYRTENLFYMTHYQHGRKDPFSGDVVHAQDKIKAVNGKINGQLSLAYGIQHPNELINFNYKTNWCSEKYFNLWSANFSILDNLDKAPKFDDNVKTIYDPCPVGYKVPPVNTFKGMDERGGKCDEGKYGWTFDITINKGGSGTNKKLFIPMSGAVIYESAAQKPVSFLYYVKNGKFPYPEAEGFYQLATSSSENDYDNSSSARLYLKHQQEKGYEPSASTNNVAEADAVLPIKDE